MVNSFYISSETYLLFAFSVTIVMDQYFTLLVAIVKVGNDYRDWETIVFAVTFNAGCIVTGKQIGRAHV